MDIVEKFAKKFNELRLKKKLSQEEVAFKAGLSVYYISKLERGKANPSLETLYKLAKALKIDVRDLF